MTLSQRFVSAYAPRSRSHRQQAAAALGPRALEGLALYAALETTSSGIHSYADIVRQNDDDAKNKGEPGLRGRRHCARHVLSYSATQFVSAVVVTRALGYRVPLYILLFGTALNGGTHYIIDRRQPLWNFLRSRLARKLRFVGNGKAAYAEFAVVQRSNGVVDKAGPGTAIMDIDQAVHRAISVFASLTMAWLTLRWASLLTPFSNGSATRAQ